MDLRKQWLDQESPSNYVAGLGRGATGFTTRSDIGPARMGPVVDPLLTVKANADDDDKEDYSESNYDEFMGYGGSLLDPTAAYDQDDKEADEVWDAVDERMDSRRRARREAKMKEEMEKYRSSRPKLQAQFADLKRELGDVSSDEWDAIPDIGDATQRHRKKAKTFFGFVPVPDTVIAKAHADNVYMPTLDKEQQVFGGYETPMGQTPMGVTSTGELSQRAVGEARHFLLTQNLAKKAGSVSGQTVVDPKMYLTDLGSIKINSEAEIGDIKKARLLLQSVRQTNPKHAPGWIASARLEEVAGLLKQARKLITQATQICPESDDVWIECARLHTPEQAKAILAKAMKQITSSVKLWLYAAGLETDVTAKKRVLRKSLEFIPNSVKLWKAAIELEKPEEARLMLARAVECVPHSVEMWLALAHLESYQNARKVLNKARESIPTDPTIWITAAKLEEAHGNPDSVKNIIKKAVKSLASHNINIDREQWLKEAENAEKTAASITCEAIIRETIGISVEEQDRKRTWTEDAESAIAHGCIQTARAIYAHALSVLPTKKSLWLRVVQLEKAHGTKESLDATLSKSVQQCPKAEVLWLMAAKEKWISGDVEGSRLVLHNAFAANPDSEQIWLAAVKLENESKEPDRARALLRKARERAGTERVWMKSALLERDLNNPTEEKALIEESLKKFPQFPKLWMMRGQLEERLGDLESARQIYQRGLKNCIHSVPLWICAALLEERFAAAKARSLLEKARLKNPKSPELWKVSLEVELRAKNPKVAQTMLAKALQECPTNGMLWAYSIDMEPLAQRKTKSVEALKRCDNDPYVITAVAKIFWADHKFDKVRTWFTRAITINADYGDAWAYYYRFLLDHGKPEEQQQLLKQCGDATPRHGELWTNVSKKIGNSALTPQQILEQVAKTLTPPS